MNKPLQTGIMNKRAFLKKTWVRFFPLLTIPDDLQKLRTLTFSTTFYSLCRHGAVCNCHILLCRFLSFLKTKKVMLHSRDGPGVTTPLLKKHCIIILLYLSLGVWKPHSSTTALERSPTQKRSSWNRDQKTMTARDVPGFYT